MLLPIFFSVILVEFKEMLFFFFLFGTYVSHERPFTNYYVYHPYFPYISQFLAGRFVFIKLFNDRKMLFSSYILKNDD